MLRINKSRFSTVAWLLTGFLVALAWGELFTAVLMPQNLDTILDILRSDETVGYTYQPNAEIMERGRGYDVPFQINSIGLRDREITPKQDDVFRILLMGNSFSVSHGVSMDESFSRAMENAMNKYQDEFQGYKKVEVINGSNAGYNAYNYWKGYERWAPDLEPDMVLVGFVSGREHKCDTEGTKYMVQDGLLQGRFEENQTVKAPRRNPVMKFRKFLARSSNSYVLFRNFLYYNEKVDWLLKRGDGVGTAMKSLKPYIVPLPTGVQKGWARAYSHLESLRDETRADGVEMMVASIPEIYQIDSQHFANLKAKTEIASDKLDQSQPTNELKKFCKNAGISVLDPGPGVAQAHAEKPAYLMDNHWNAVGIAGGAEAMVQQWREMGGGPFGH